MSTLELAQKYYPRLWSAERIHALVAAGRLTQAEADMVMGIGAETEQAAEE